MYLASWNLITFQFQDVIICVLSVNILQTLILLPIVMKEVVTGISCMLRSRVVVLSRFYNLYHNLQMWQHWPKRGVKRVFVMQINGLYRIVWFTKKKYFIYIINIIFLYLLIFTCFALELFFGLESHQSTNFQGTNNWPNVRVQSSPYSNLDFLQDYLISDTRRVYIILYKTLRTNEQSYLLFKVHFSNNIPVYFLHICTPHQIFITAKQVIQEFGITNFFKQLLEEFLNEQIRTR